MIPSYHLHHHQHHHQHNHHHSHQSNIPEVEPEKIEASHNATIEDSHSTSGQHESGPSSSNESNNLGNSIFYDDPDAVVLSFTPDPVLTQKAIERTQSKIENVKKEIHLEQVSKEENVNEFLKLCNNADRQQQSRMKQFFEKKNQKSAQNIAQLQKKLEEYQKKLKELETFGVPQKPSQKVRDRVQGLRSVGGNIISKPKELAHRLRHKFGSADNLNALGKESSKVANTNPHGSSSLPRDNPGTRATTLYASEHQSSFEDDEVGPMSRNRSTVASEKSYATSESIPPGMVAPQMVMYGRNSSTEWKSVMQELSMHKEEVEKLREDMEEVKLQLKQEIETLKDKLREERERCERLEDQLNDLTELHQHEVESIKTGVKDMEEKVQYQSEERLMDIKEHLQGLETKLNSLEHQHAQQQYINLDGLNNSESRAIFMKLLTVVLNFIHLGLWLVGTCLHLAKPFCRSKGRMLLSIFVGMACVGIYYHKNDVETVLTFLWTQQQQHLQQTNTVRQS